MTSDRSRQQPDSSSIEHAAIAAPTPPDGPRFTAWVGNTSNLEVIAVGHLYELRKSGGHEQSANMILLEQDARAASVPRGEQLPNEVHDERLCRTADIFRLAYDVSDGRAGFVNFALPPLAGNDVRGVAAAARRMWYRARRTRCIASGGNARA